MPDLVRIVVLSLICGLALPAYGDANPLSAAFAAAWARQPGVAALALRQSAQDSRRVAAAAWTPSPVALDVAGQTDRYGRNRGGREIELGVSVPLWLPGERAASVAAASAETGVFEASLAFARWELAGALRQAWWDWQLARNEALALAAEVATAQALRDDVARRFRAGDLALADQHLADGMLAGLQATLAEAESRREAAAQRLQAMTGQFPPEADVAAETPPGEAVLPASHPQLAQWAAQAELARQKERVMRTRTRANPELTVTTRREQGAIGDPTERFWGVAIRLPLAGESQRTAQLDASAERTEAEILLARESERLQQGVALARSQWLSAQRAAEAAGTWARLAGERQQFIDKAFRLGEIDLPGQLRAVQEAQQARQARIRAQIQLAASLSALRQALGLLPE